MKRLFVLLSILLFMAAPVHADSIAPPHSYTVVTSNGQYVFVMLAPVVPADDGALMRPDLAAAIRDIRRTYTMSGLYRNDGSTTPLWTVDWYAYHIEVASDGVHLLRHVSSATSPHDEAVAFFADGQLLQAYRVRDLMDVPWLLPPSVLFIHWTDDDLVQFDEAAQTHTIRTVHGERWVFDITTGTVIDAWHPVRWLGAIGISAIGFFTWAFRRMGRTPSRRTGRANGARLQI